MQFLFTVLVLLINYFIEYKCTYTTSGNAEYTDDCHWEFPEYKIQCPIKYDNYSSCIGNDIGKDTPRAIRFLCGISGYVYISWDITPFDTSGKISDNYVIMATSGEWCNDPMRAYSNVHIPTKQLRNNWQQSNNTFFPMCISIENKNNHCYMNSAELFIPYSHGPGCILLYCDNMWDPCMLNMKISIDQSYNFLHFSHFNLTEPVLHNINTTTEVWIESSTERIRLFSKQISINGAGFDSICIHNKIECFDSHNNKPLCYCHSVEKGSMKIGFTKQLTHKNKGEISVSVTVRDLKRIPPVVVGVLDYSNFGMRQQKEFSVHSKQITYKITHKKRKQDAYRTVLSTELFVVLSGCLIGIAIWTIHKCYTFIQLKKQQREQYTAISNVQI
eukprot:522290_1